MTLDGTLEERATLPVDASGPSGSSRSSPKASRVRPGSSLCALGAFEEGGTSARRTIFASPTGEPYKERSVAHLLRELLAGGRGKDVPAEVDVTLYDMRHFFASEHAAPGPAHMAIESLGAHLGHSPASIKVLLRWYVDQSALRRGAPVSVLGESKDGKVVPMQKAKG